MAIIYSYPIATPQGTDLLVISRTPTDPDEISNYSVDMSSVADYVIDKAFNGTDRYIPRFDGTSSLVNSVIYQDSNGNIGIGTQTPGTSKLKVNGSTNITGDVKIDTLTNNYIPVNNSSGVLRDSGFYQVPLGTNTLNAIGLNTTKLDSSYGEYPDFRVASRSLNDPGVLDLFRPDGDVQAGDRVGILQYSLDDDNQYAVAQIEVKTISQPGTGNSGGGKLCIKTSSNQNGAQPTERLCIDNTEADFSVPINVTDLNRSSFAGQVTIPLTPVANTDAASKGYVDAQNTGQVTGTGTTNVLPIWTDGPNSDLGNSIITQDVGATTATVTGGLTVTNRVGIGITQPTAKLHVEAGTTEDIKLNVDEGNVRIVSGTSAGSFFVTSFDNISMQPENTFSIGSSFYVNYVDSLVGFGTNNPNDGVQIVGGSDAKTSLSLLSNDNALSVKPNSSTDTKFTVNRDSGTDILLQASNTAGTVANDIKINPFGGDLFVGQKPAAQTFSNGGSIKFDVGDYDSDPRIVTLQSKASSTDGGGFQFKSNNLTLFEILPDDNGNVTYNFSSTDSFTVNAQSNLTLTGDEGVTISSNADEGFLLKESGTTFLQTRVDQFSNDGTGCETTSLKTGRFGIAALSTPASSSATGTTGEIRVDANYIYVCTATNTWKRTQINTW